MLKKLLAGAGVFCLCASLFASGTPPAAAAGASLFFSPGSGTKTINTNFSVSVKINTGGETINAAQGALSFDPAVLEAVSVSRSGSIFNLWTTEPAANNKNGTIDFGGGVPQPGYAGAAGTVFSITFKAKKAGSAAVRFSAGAILANDGKGTNILASLGGANFTIAPAQAAPVPAEKKTGETPPPPVKTEPDAPYNLPVITSATHPDQNAWYNKSEARLAWVLPPDTAAISLTLDREPDTAAPTGEAIDPVAEKEYPELTDGLWYFHLRFKDKKKWGTTEHYRLMIDTKPPAPIDLRLEEKAEGEWPLLRFKSFDDGSGLLVYELIMNSLQEKARQIAPEVGEMALDNLEIGEHSALVKAIDKAGNERVAVIDFAIKPLPAPVITDFTANLKPGEHFFLSGRSLPEAQIKISVLDEAGRIAVGASSADKSGNWFYVHQAQLPRGRYFVWAEATNANGLKSNLSEKPSFVVSPPAFAIFGDFLINYFTLIMSLLFLIVLIIALFVYIVRAWRRRLRKETFEIEDVLRRHLGDLAKGLEADFSVLGRARGLEAQKKERLAILESAKSRINAAQEKIGKEVKDVEEILK